MRDSLFACFQDKTWGVIGGAGALGALFVRWLQPHCKKVIVVDVDNAHQAPDLLPECDFVIFSVPIHYSPALVEEYSQWIRDDAAICDITSIKTPTVRAMLQHHQGPVVGYHPMFGPDTPSLQGQVVIRCPGRQEEAFADFERWLREHGALVRTTTPEKHDRLMVHMQAVRHFLTFLQGSFTAAEGFDLEELIQLSSPIYNLELIMIGRLFAQNPRLYADIIYDNPQSVEVLSRYAQLVNQAVADLKQGDKEHFIRGFEQAGAYFGTHAAQFMEQSAEILHTTRTMSSLNHLSTRDAKEPKN